MPTLDVEYVQVLVDFPLDANGFFWHHRLLVVPLGGSVWIGCTPDESIQRIDLSGHRVIVLRRNSPFPAARLAETYAFDEVGFTAAVRDRVVEECRALATVHGGVPAAAVAGDNTWRICDTSHASFGELVPAAVLSDDQLFVERGDEALVRVDGKWTHAAKTVAGATEDEFKRGYHSGPGRDRRVMADGRDPDGRRFLALLVALLELPSSAKVDQTDANAKSQIFHRLAPIR